LTPVYTLEFAETVLYLQKCIKSVIAKRHIVTAEKPKAGLPIYIIKVMILAIDSLGFEIDLRVHKTGEAFCSSTLNHWNMLHGDHLDKKIGLRLPESVQPH
jgi:U5 small nuclear ribonucleoprotein component